MKTAYKREPLGTFRNASAADLEASPGWVHRFEPRGNMRLIWGDRSPEIMYAGPAGTGKSRNILEYLHALLCKYPGTRALMARKTRRSLTESGMTTYENKVRPDLDGVVWNGSKQQYIYPNGSVLAVAGLDKPGKIMSSEWDVIYVQEALDITLADWESLSTRLGRNTALPFAQLVGDCNPGPPTHWIQRRAQDGVLKLIETRHEENPALFDNGDWTEMGREYLARLDRLTGVRLQRLRYGRWVAAEGIVYEQWDRAVHVIPRKEITQPGEGGRPQIPGTWPRYVFVDFGFVNPAVVQWWAADPDGRIYLYREIYVSGMLTEDLAREALRLSQNEPRPRGVVCDHDAQERATFERHTGWITYPANKAIINGIQAVQARMRPAGDGRPRLYILDDAVDQGLGRDRTLADDFLPTCTADEIDAYVWDVRNGRAPKEEPLDLNNHGCDAMRYAVAYFDLEERGVEYGPRIYG